MRARLFTFLAAYGWLVPKFGRILHEDGMVVDDFSGI